MQSLDQAVGQAMEATKVVAPAPAPAAKRGPGRPPKPKPSAPAVSESQQKASAPAVIVQRSGHRVRLRNIDHALEGCISVEGRGEIRYRLEPNQWTRVDDIVYTELKRKFYDVHEYEVPDWEVGGEQDSAKRTPRKERVEEYTVEFPDEAPLE